MYKVTEIGGPEFFMIASWGERAETPAEIATRFVRQIDLLSKIDPIFSLWTCGAKRPTKFESVRERYADEVAASVSMDDFGIPTPIEGYWFGAVTRSQPDSFSYGLNVNAGAFMKGPAFQNSVQLTTVYNALPDPSIVTYRILKSALLSIVEIWAPADVTALPQDLLKFANLEDHFRIAWIQYLSPQFARRITPPDTAIIDHLPNGALLMSATTETFRVDNPAHLAVARDIEAAMAPLNNPPA